MADKQVIFITGGNTGLGYEVVKSLCKTSTAYEIILGSRSVEKGEDAVATVKKDVPESSSTLSVVQIDVTSDDSVQRAVGSITSTHGRLDVLINNAGGSFDRELQAGKLSIREAFNKSWDLNITGAQVLTSLSMPLLLKSPNARLMFVTSGTASLAETERFDHPALARINASPAAGWPKDEGVNPITSYRSSKAGLNMLMREWYKLLKNDGVKVWAISPGFLATGLGGIGAETLRKLGARDPSEGGDFIKDVIEGKRDHDQGKVVRVQMIQPW
ncbi:hypothetical protein LTR36_004336 [Oleoguttula mirabilis]|uniref:NAD(P)-binding protein n=1 Tax=Oleoguttula mirabilis TaxID=1507867 RepID=A0AAV9JGH5_9PEZI|nr:hypothetical protein LTR36_004336 [Oleoguttula mirabilis]